MTMAKIQTCGLSTTCHATCHSSQLKCATQ